MKANSIASLRRHLMLMAASRGAVFWYGIEKLYYLQIGITLRQVVLLGMLSQCSKILFEIPTSVYADRWSRRNTLIASYFIFIVASCVLGLATNIWGIVAGTIVWSLSDSLLSGVYEAFTYDSLKARGKAHLYRSTYARMLSTEFLVMAVAGVAASLIGSQVGMRINFFLTVMPLFLAMYILWRMDEPDITRTTQLGEKWYTHLGGALKIIRKPGLKWVVALYAALMSTTYLWYSNYQLVGVEVRLPEAWFGLLISALLLGMVAASEISHKLAGTRGVVLLGWLTLVIATVVGLRINQPFAAIGI